MSDKTREEYESIKALWRTMEGVVSDNLLTPDDGRPPYRCATLREECAATPQAVAPVLARMGALAVMEGAYLTMHVHAASVMVQLLVSTKEVDPPPYVVQTPTPPEVEADFERAGDPADGDAVANVAREMLSDMDAIKSTEEDFRPRPIGRDKTPGCFVCGTGDHNEYRINFAAFVASKASGLRVVALFRHGARLDYRTVEPDWIQVKIGACDKHVPNLEHLRSMTMTDNKIDRQRIGLAMGDVGVTPSERASLGVGGGEV